MSFRQSESFYVLSNQALHDEKKYQIEFGNRKVFFIFFKCNKLLKFIHNTGVYNNQLDTYY
jgi:hypothetical protein